MLTFRFAVLKTPWWLLCITGQSERSRADFSHFQASFVDLLLHVILDVSHVQRIRDFFGNALYKCSFYWLTYYWWVRPGSAHGWAFRAHHRQRRDWLKRRCVYNDENSLITPSCNTLVLILTRLDPSRHWSWVQIGIVAMHSVLKRNAVEPHCHRHSAVLVS